MQAYFGANPIGMSQSHAANWIMKVIERWGESKNIPGEEDNWLAFQVSATRTNLALLAKWLTCARLSHAFAAFSAGWTSASKETINTSVSSRLIEHPREPTFSLRCMCRSSKSLYLLKTVQDLVPPELARYTLMEYNAYSFPDSLHEPKKWKINYKISPFSILTAFS